jgi:hypothetical protein
VIQINYVTKRRALRYVAGAQKDWLYPERRLRDDHWRKLGDGYLFMPEPREIHMGGEIYFGFEDGSSEAFGTYGHRPWQEGYEDAARESRERNSLERFKAEWAAKYGPEYRAISFAFGGRSLKSDSPDMHVRYLATDAEYRVRQGERQRRRRLTRKT